MDRLCFWKDVESACRHHIAFRRRGRKEGIGQVGHRHRSLAGKFKLDNGNWVVGLE
jgi:hypothetical protein